MKRNGELEAKDIRIGDLERREWRKSYETLSVSAKPSREGKSLALGNEGFYHLKHRRFNLNCFARKTRLAVACGIHACVCFSDHPQRRHDDTRIYEVCRAVLFDGTAVL